MYGNKINMKAHITDEHGLTYCHAENGSSKLVNFSERPPAERKICSNCERLIAKGKKRTEKSNNQVNREQSRNFYKSRAWVKLRYDILKDATHCLCCGATKKEARLTVDHVKPLWKYPKLKLDPDNMQVLCLLCNKGKGGKDETDFRLE